MKLIHCADLHLDAKMTSNLDGERARERRQELLLTFRRMVSYAAKNGVSGILIAGDLFDGATILKTTRNVVLREIEEHPEVVFYYLKGNHDTDRFLAGLETLPSNLKLFGQEWTCYVAGERVRIYGVELTKENAQAVYDSFVADAGKINLVMLHGQESETGSKDKSQVIRLRALQNRGIDYLALGHIHSYKMAPLDARGRYCYPGCLEGRGFDECGSHGFVVLDIDEAAGEIASRFVPFASRLLHTVMVDVTGCMESSQMAEKIENALRQGDYGGGSLIKLVLTGTLAVECEKNIAYLKKLFEPEFYFLKISDETQFYIDPEDYRMDVSLRGEFIRAVEAAEDVSDEDKSTIIRYGLQILDGNKEVEE